MNKKIKIKKFKSPGEQEKTDIKFWCNKSPNEKMKLYEEAFNNYYFSQYGKKPRLQRVVTITKRQKS
jgi:hypothetical protein